MGAMQTAQTGTCLNPIFLQPQISRLHDLVCLSHGLVSATMPPEGHDIKADMAVARYEHGSHEQQESNTWRSPKPPHGALRADGGPSALASLRRRQAVRGAASLLGKLWGELKGSHPLL